MSAAELDLQPRMLRSPWAPRPSLHLDLSVLSVCAPPPRQPPAPCLRLLPLFCTYGLAHSRQPVPHVPACPHGCTPSVPLFPGLPNRLQHHLKGPWSSIPEGLTESPVVTTGAVTMEGKRDNHSLDSWTCTGEACFPGLLCTNGGGGTLTCCVVTYLPSPMWYSSPQL